MIRLMMQEDMGKMCDDFTTFISSIPEERYLALIEKDQVLWIEFHKINWSVI